MRSSNITRIEILDLLNKKTENLCIKALFETENVTKRVHYAGGISLYENVSYQILKLICENVKKGMPYFSINSKVFLRNFIMMPFRILGLAHRRIKIGNREIDSRLDLYFSSKHKKNELTKIHSFLFDETFKKHYNKLINDNFNGSIKYDSSILSFETTKIPKNEGNMNSLYTTIEIMGEIRKFLI